MSIRLEMRIKTLVISHNSFSKTHNNGKTLSAIFSAFEIEELCQLFFTPIGGPDLDRCENYYLISDKDALNSILFRTKCGTSIIEPPRTTTTNSKRFKPSVATRLIRTVVWRCASWYHGGLNKWLAIQKPNVIFYVGGDGVFSHQIAVKLSHKLKLPLVSYFTDDYVINPPSDLYVRILKHYYKKTIQQSSLLFAIGEQMALSYSEYYNRQFLPIMNIVDIPNNEPVYNPHHDVVKIKYFGGLHLGRANEIAKCVEFLRVFVTPFMTKEINVEVFTFSLVSEKMRRDYERLDISVFNGLTGAELDKSMCEADVFLHVESIEPQYRSLTRLSVSTKIPEYLCKARPILAFGPREVASFGVIESVIPELVVDDNANNKSRALEVAELLNNNEKLKEIAHRGFEYAKNHFDKAVVSRNFREELMKLTTANSGEHSTLF